MSTLWRGPNYAQQTAQIVWVAYKGQSAELYLGLTLLNTFCHQLVQRSNPRLFQYLCQKMSLTDGKTIHTKDAEAKVEAQSSDVSLEQHTGQLIEREHASGHLQRAFTSRQIHVSYLLPSVNSGSMLIDSPGSFTRWTDRSWPIHLFGPKPS